MRFVPFTTLFHPNVPVANGSVQSLPYDTPVVLVLPVRAVLHVYVTLYRLLLWLWVQQALSSRILARLVAMLVAAAS